MSNESDKRLSQLILNCDVLLLANVFEKFRNNILKMYGPCRSLYLSKTKKNKKKKQ